MKKNQKKYRSLIPAATESPIKKICVKKSEIVNFDAKPCFALLASLRKVIFRGIINFEFPILKNIDSHNIQN